MNSAIAVSAYVADNVRPTLTAFTLDWAAQNIYFKFSETVVAAHANVSSATLTGNEPTAARFALYGTITGFGMQWLNLTLPEDLINAVKLEYSVCLAANRCVIELGDAFVADYAGNRVQSIASSAQFHAQAVVPETVPPEIVACTVDMNLGVVRIEMNEPVQTARILATDFGLVGEGVADNVSNGSNGMQIISAHKCLWYDWLV